MTTAKQGMPPDLAAIHEALWQEVVWLHARWNIYCQLYSTDKETVDLLNRSAQSFFHVCQDMWIDDILLRLSRLTDPFQTGGKDNISLERLILHIDQQTHGPWFNTVNQKLNVARASCTSARERRNKQIAHMDFNTYFNRHSAPLPPIPKQDVENALEAIREIMNEVEVYFEKRETAYSLAPLPGDGDALLACLRNAEAYKEQHQRR